MIKIPDRFNLIIPFFKENWVRVVSGLLLIIFVDILQLMIPKILQIAIDKFELETFTRPDLFKYALAIFLIAIGIAGVRYLWRILLLTNGWQIDRDLRQKYYEHLLRLSSNFFNKQKIGDLMAYATNDLNAVRMLVNFGIVGGTDILFLTVSTIFFMVNINLKLTLYAVLPLPILSIIIIIFGRKIHRRFKSVQKTFATLSGKIQESISGIRVIKAFAQEEAELDKISDSAYDYVKDNLALIKIVGFFWPIIHLIIGFSMLIVLYFGGKAAILTEISMGKFIAFFSYLGMLVWPMIAIGWVVNLYERGSASLQRLSEVFDVEPEIVDESPDYSIHEIKGKIDVNNLSFRYNKQSEKIFDKISVSVDKGNTLAIVGRTGCGKTTLVELLTRVYNPPRDSIYFDKNEIYEIPLKVLHNDIIIVPQDMFLFSDTIEENLILGKNDATEEEIKNITKKVQVHNDIVDFKNGYDTVIGERGVTLSGGQKQRIGIARALITNPNVLILDDSLSAVDTKTEKNILENLIEIRKGKTTIIIAHRISSIQHADKIIVLDNKKIAEKGTHEELLKLNGIYKDLYEKQQLEEEINKEKAD